MCNSLFVYFFLVPPPSPPPRPLVSLFFFIPFLGLADTSDLHCLKTFVCASEHVCYSGIFGVLLLVTQQLIFLFVRLFLSWLHYCSIVLCLIVQQQRTLTPPSVFDNHSLSCDIVTQRVFIIIIIILLRKKRLNRSSWWEHKCYNFGYY